MIVVSQYVISMKCAELHVYVTMNYAKTCILSVWLHNPKWTESAKFLVANFYVPSNKLFIKIKNCIKKISLLLLHSISSYKVVNCTSQVFFSKRAIYLFISLLNFFCCSNTSFLLCCRLVLETAGLGAGDI